MASSKVLMTAYLTVLESVVLMGSTTGMSLVELMVEKLDVTLVFLKDVLMAESMVEKKVA